MSDQQLSLSQLQSLIKQGVDQAHPLPYWVVAEVSELKVNYSGHCYLELVEKGGDNHLPRAKASAIIWRSTYQLVAPYFEQTTGEPLSVGLRVLVKVVVAYHELYGLSLQIADIEPSYTMGEMHRQRQQTIASLQSDGIFEMNHEASWPYVTQRLAVISSRNAAGYQDFMNELTSSPYYFEATLFDAFMQGAEAEDSIIEALDRVAEQIEAFDVVVLIRGGGSQSELGVFNGYRLCSHLAQFPLPVITGIGHDKDESVADLVAALSLKTPTAVAVFFKNRAAEFDTQLEILSDQLRQCCESTLWGEKEHLRQHAFTLQRVSSGMTHALQLSLARLQGELHHYAQRTLQTKSQSLHHYSGPLAQLAHQQVARRIERTTTLFGALKQQTLRLLAAQSQQLNWHGEMIHAHDPAQILRRGFALVRQGGALVDAVAHVERSLSLEIELYDGFVEAEVSKIQIKNQKNGEEKNDLYPSN